jgi:hypothetical protein
VPKPETGALLLVDVCAPAKDSPRRYFSFAGILCGRSVVLGGAGVHRARRPKGDEIMQRVTLVRYATKPDRADENEKLSRAVFAELRAQKPEQVVYALFRDGANFVHLFVNAKGEDSAILTELPSFKAFIKNTSERFEAPAEQTRIDTYLVEAYGLSDVMADA